MRNDYAGTCTRCGKLVPALAGILERGTDGSWQVRHPSRGERSCQHAAAQVSSVAAPEWKPAMYAGRCSRCGAYETVPAALEYSRTQRIVRHIEPEGAGRTCEAARADARARAEAAHASCDAERAARAEQARTAVEERRNLRADECSRCGGPVAPGDGRLWLDDAADEDGDHDFCFWSKRPILADTRYADHRQSHYAVAHLDAGACERNEAAFEARAAAARARAAATNAARARLELALQSVEDVAPTWSDSERVQVSPPGLRLTGYDRYYLIEPAAASPRRILEITYQGADGDAWGEYKYGWNTSARVADFSEDLAAEVRLQAHRGPDLDPLAGWVEPE